MTQTRYGYCLTTLEVAVTLLADEKDLIQMEDDPNVDDEDMFDPQKMAQSRLHKSMRASIKKTQERTFSLIVQGDNQVMEDVVEVDQRLVNKRLSMSRQHSRGSVQKGGGSSSNLLAGLKAKNSGGYSSSVLLERSPFAANRRKDS